MAHCKTMTISNDTICTWHCGSEQDSDLTYSRSFEVFPRQGNGPRAETEGMKGRNREKHQVAKGGTAEMNRNLVLWGFKNLLDFFLSFPLILRAIGSQFFLLIEGVYH